MTSSNTKCRSEISLFSANSTSGACLSLIALLSSFEDLPTNSTRVTTLAKLESGSMNRERHQRTRIAHEAVELSQTKKRKIK